MQRLLRSVFLVGLAIIATSINVSAQKQKLKSEELLGVKNAQGREFWIAVPPNELEPFPTNELEIYIAAEDDAVVQVYDAGTQTTKTYNVNAGDILTLTDARGETRWSWELREFEVPIAKAIQITSDVPVVVYVLNSKTTSSDGYLSIPVRAWGTDYIHCSYYDFREIKAWAGGFIVLSQEDGTIIDVDLRGVGADGAKTSGGKTINTGAHYSVTLAEGEVYMVKGDGTTRGTFDLSGSRVTSNKPIGMISFHERTTMPNLLVNGNGRNHLCEMMPPVTAWGMRYATVEFSRENRNGIGKGDVFRVVASEPDTKWNLKYYDKTTKALIGQAGGVLAKSGDFADIEQATAPKALINGYSVWTADQPVLLMQYSCSQSWDGDPILDPFMIYIAPVEQFSTNSVFQAPTAAKFQKHRLNLIVWADVNDPNYVDNLKSLEIDGVPVWSHPNSATPKLLANNMPGGQNLHWCTIDFGTEAKSHQILSNEKIRCAGYLYGFGAADAFGWPVGAHYRDLSSIDTASPVLSIEGACGEFNARATELRNLPAVPRVKPLRSDQVETGISEIEFDPAYANINFRIVLETSPILGEVSYKDFRFRVEVIDKSKEASARVRVRDFGFTENLGPANATYQLLTYKPLKLTGFSSILDFGKHKVGVPSSQIIPIRHDYSEPMVITGLKLAVGERFQIDLKGRSLPISVPPGVTDTFTVTYDALKDSATGPAGKDLDTLVIEVGCESTSITVSGFAVQPMIQVADASLGVAPAGTKRCAPVYLTNPGSEELIVTGISGFEGSNFSLTSPLTPSLPFQIPPGRSVNISSMCFESTGDAEASVSVTFSSNAALGDSVSVWTANAVTSVEESELFPVFVSPQPASDVLNVRFDASEVKVRRVAIVDMQGTVVGVWNFDGNCPAQLSVSVSHFASGSYTLVTTLADTTYALPIVISR